MKETRKHRNTDGCMWLDITPSIFDEEKVDAINIELPGISIYIHKGSLRP